MTMRRLAMGIALSAVSLVCAPSPISAQESLRVELPGGDARSFTRSQLELLSSDTIRVEGKHLTSAMYQVIPLQRLLAVSGLPLDSLRGRDLAQVVMAEARDGYRVAFSLGELSPALGAGEVLVAFRRDGLPIPSADGPFRLLVPGDGRASRSLRQLERLGVRVVGSGAGAAHSSHRSSPSATKASSRSPG